MKLIAIFCCVVFLSVSAATVNGSQTNLKKAEVARYAAQLMNVSSAGMVKFLLSNSRKLATAI